MKKIIIFCLALLLVGTAIIVVNDYKKENVVSVINNIFRQVNTSEKVTQEKKGDPETRKNQEVKDTIKSEKICALWLTYSEIGGLVKGKSESEYIESLEAIFGKLKESKINTVFYQCRAFCDSFYTSEIFPVSKYVCADNKNPTFDPLEIFARMGKENGIAVHCWVNPYRVSYDSEFKNLSKSSPARELYKKDKNTLIICEKGVFLNPAHTESRKLVLSGIRELLEKYPVSGIHFDDYFYPESENINDKALYKEYTENGGKFSLAEWRRENVNALVSSVYTLVKAENESLVFSISPSADIEKCKNVFYADVQKWCSEGGFADYIIPQLYYGFENEEMPFQRVFEQWSALGEKGRIKLVCGFSAYKCGQTDKFAGTGKNEWTENVNILSRQYEQVSKKPVWQGFALFSYSWCFGENVNEFSEKEIKKLLNMVE